MKARKVNEALTRGGHPYDTMGVGLDKDRNFELDKEALEFLSRFYHIVPYRRNRNGEFNWRFGFLDDDGTPTTGYNDTWAFTKEEAIQRAQEEMGSLKVNPKSFSKTTTQDNY